MPQRVITVTFAGKKTDALAAQIQFSDNYAAQFFTGCIVNERTDVDEPTTTLSFDPSNTTLATQMIKATTVWKKKGHSFSIKDQNTPTHKPAGSDDGEEKAPEEGEEASRSKLTTDRPTRYVSGGAGGAGRAPTLWSPPAVDSSLPPKKSPPGSSPR